MKYCGTEPGTKMVNESLLTHIVQLSPDSVIAIDDQQKIIFANPGASETFGYDISEMMGQPLNMLLPADIGEKHEALIQGFASSELTSKMMGERKEISGRRKDGTLFPAQVTIVKFKENDRWLFAVLLRDITEFHKQYQRINSLAKFPDENPYPVMRIGNDGALIYGNAGSRQLLDEWNCKVGEKTPVDIRQFISEAVADGRIKEIEINIENETFSLMIVPIESEHYVNVYGKNISERKQAEKRTEKQLSRLAALRKIDIAIASGLMQKAILDVVLTQVVGELGVHAADILLIEPEQSNLEYAAGSGFNTDYFKSAHLEIGEGYAGKVALSKEPSYVVDIADKRMSIRPPIAFKKEGFVTYIAVPLIAKDKVKGVLEVFQRDAFEPDDEWMDYLETLAGQAAIALESTQLFDGLQRANENLSLAYDETLEGWSRALDLRDRETEGHTRRVTERTIELAQAMGLDEEMLVHVRRGALLHDIGKMGVPDSILLKPGPLTDEEWKVMRLHPKLAYDMLSQIAYLHPALNIPYYHHEKWDGSGYPFGLKGEEIPIEARIFAIIDVCDALASDRPYRKAWPQEKIQEFIKGESGKHFDPAVVEKFFEIMASKA